MTESTEDQMKRMFGEDGLNNLKEHAKLLNVSLATFVFMANFTPSELARQLQDALDEKRGDLIVIDVTSGEVYKIEVKTARQCKDGKWRFTLVKDGHTNHQHADMVVLLAVMSSGRVVPFVMPVEAVADQRQAVITSHPERYAGKLARWRVEGQVNLNVQKMSCQKGKIEMSDILYPYTDESPEERKGNQAAGRALRLIALERARQDAKWGQQNHNGAIWSLIAGEEFGEVAQAQLEVMFKGSQKESDPHPRQAYITELVQLAAVCQAWLECELRRNGDK